jgi:hypothetical protein
LAPCAGARPPASCYHSWFVATQRRHHRPRRPR